MHELPWITIFCHEWGDSAMIFTSDEVTNENHWRIASRVTKKSLFTVTNVLFYFLHAISCHEHTDPLRTIFERSFRHCCQARPFLTQHCDVTTIDLWRLANAKYWYCDVIFVYCHCTCKLAQRRITAVNIDISPPGIHGLACKKYIYICVCNEPNVAFRLKPEPYSRGKNLISFWFKIHKIPFHGIKVTVVCTFRQWIGTEHMEAVQYYIRSVIVRDRSFKFLQCICNQVCVSWNKPHNSPHKGQWRGALMVSLISAWINDWVNNHEDGDLRRHRGHYDVL